VESVELLEEIGNPIYKICSFHVTNMLLIWAVCATVKPIVLSTGMSNLYEVDNAVNFIMKHTSALTILHCVSSYPAKTEDLHYNTISFLKRRYMVPVGYSSHDEDRFLALSTIPLGVSMIEKHFTLDRTMKGPDHHLSLDPEQMEKFVRYARKIEAALGHTDKKLLECEMPTREKYL
jgi:sialic acid synthase SpsE